MVSSYYVLHLSDVMTCKCGENADRVAEGGCQEEESEKGRHALGPRRLDSFSIQETGSWLGVS